MNTLVIEHVAFDDLPEAWRAGMHVAANARVTVRIEEEQAQSPVTGGNDNPLFGMWRDRADMADVSHYAEQLRSARYGVDGWQPEK